MKKKPKLLHVVEAMGGGVFTYIVTLANGLCDEFDITIAYGVRKELPKNFREYFDSRVKLIRVENFTREVKPIKDWRSARELLRIVDKVQPDVVHLHSSKAGVLGRIFLSKKCMKMFYTPHGYSFFMEDTSSMKRGIYKAIEKICGQRRCITVACGQGEWEQSQKVCKHSTYVWNGIETEKIDAVMQEQFTKDNEFTVYTVGRIKFQKNPEKFNKIAEFLPDIKFCWIGDGGMRDVLTSPNIEITGWKEVEDVLRLARKGDVFILTSRWEGLPISLLEAMYMKKICIVSDVVGNHDIIIDGKTGYVCDTPKQFAQKIQEIKDGCCDTLIENAYQEVLEQHSDQEMCKRYAKIYRDDSLWDF